MEPSLQHDPAARVEQLRAQVATLQDLVRAHEAGAPAVEKFWRDVDALVEFFASRLSARLERPAWLSPPPDWCRECGALIPYAVATPLCDPCLSKPVGDPSIPPDDEDLAAAVERLASVRIARAWDLAAGPDLSARVLYDRTTGKILSVTTFPEGGPDGLPLGGPDLVRAGAPGAGAEPCPPAAAPAGGGLTREVCLAHLLEEPCPMCASYKAAGL